MNMRTNELMLYKHIEEGQILTDMTFLMENYDNDYYNKEDLKGLLFDVINEILELSFAKVDTDKMEPIIEAILNWDAFIKNSSRFCFYMGPGSARDP